MTRRVLAPAGRAHVGPLIPSFRTGAGARRDADRGEEVGFKLAAAAVKARVMSEQHQASFNYVCVCPKSSPFLSRSKARDIALS